MKRAIPVQRGRSETAACFTPVHGVAIPQSGVREAIAGATPVHGAMNDLVQTENKRAQEPMNLTLLSKCVGLPVSATCGESSAPQGTREQGFRTATF